MNDLPAECDISTVHVGVHIDSATRSLGFNDLEQVAHDLDIALRITRALLEEVKS